MRGASRRAPRRALSLATVLVGFTLALLGMVVSAAPASAHSVLVGSTPEQGAEVGTAPAAVSLTFSEGVGLSRQSVKVLDARGHRVDVGKPHHVAGQASSVAVDLKPGLSNGSYVVSWRVVSSDSHPVEGTFSFGVGVPAGTAPPAADAQTVVGVLDGLLRALAYAGAALLLGGSTFVVLLWPAGLVLPRPRRLIKVGWLASVLAAVGLFFLQGPYGAGTGAASVLDLSLAGATFATRFGVLMLMRLMVLVFAAVVLTGLISASEEEARPMRWFLAGLGGMFLLTFSLSMHAGQGDLAAVWAALDAAHLAAASVWIGGLVVLAHAMLGRFTTADLVEVLPRWSHLAMIAVATLVLTGAAQAWREIGSFAALTSTTYGYLVLAKVAGLCVLLVLANMGRNWVNRNTMKTPAPASLTPALAPTVSASPGTTTTTKLLKAPTPLQPDGPTVRQLRTSVIAEVAIGAVVLAVTAVLVATVPANVDYSPPYSATVVGHGNNGENITVKLDIAQTKVGATKMRIHTSSGRRPLPFQQVVGSLTERSKGLGPVKFTFTPTQTGNGTADAVVLPTAGTWTLVTQVRTDETTDYSATTVYTVR